MLPQTSTGGQASTGRRQGHGSRDGDVPPEPSPFLLLLVQMVKDTILYIEKGDFSDPSDFSQWLYCFHFFGMFPGDIAKQADVPTTDVVLWMGSVKAPEPERRKPILDAAVDVLFIRGLRVAGKAYDPLTGAFIRKLEEEELVPFIPSS